MKNNIKIWNKSINNIINEDIIYQDFIKIKNKIFILSKEFILTNSKLFYLKNNKIEKYVDLNNINIKFKNQELIIIISNNYNFFELFFDNLLKYLNWKKHLSSVCKILDFYENYKILEPIFKNKNSNIFKIQKKDNNKFYILKYLKKNKNSINNITNEIKIMRRLGKHPNIIRIKEVYESNNSFYLVMNLANLLNLKDCLDKKLQINNIDLIKDILNGLKYIHSKNIIHRDIKPSNIFLHKTKNNKIIAKIGDFGISYLLNEGPNIKKIGTLWYIAPEILNYKKYNIFSFKFEIDIYSIGCLMYYIYFKQNIFIFENINELKYKNKKNDFFLNKNFYIENKKIQKIILKCLKTNPDKRIILIQLIKYFNNYN